VKLSNEWIVEGGGEEDVERRTWRGGRGEEER
jgi:hypothetical protein